MERRKKEGEREKGGGRTRERGERSETRRLAIEGAVTVWLSLDNVGS